MPRQIGGFRARLEFLPVAALVRIFTAMPVERAVKAGAALGSIIMRLDLGNRPIAERNLEIAFPELDRDARLKILIAMYRNWGRVIAEWPHAGALNRGNVEQFVTYDGIENLNQALKLAAKRGVIILTAHYGNFELLPLAHSIYGHRLAMIHRPLRNPQIDEQIRRVRTSFGAEIIERKQAGLALVKYLRQKWQVAVALACSLISSANRRAPATASRASRWRPARRLFRPSWCAMVTPRAIASPSCRSWR
jgi:lauroyl/myristoyl acyltransferase